MSPELHEKYKNKIQNFLRDLGENPERGGLLKTPERWLKSMEYLTSGYTQDVKQVMNDAVFKETYKDMVVVKDIEIYSLCEHHILPFYGRCHVGYIPDGRVIGLSKIPRIVEIFARRLQVQERLTHQIADALQDNLKPLGVGVVIEACHLCMMMRGVAKQNSFTLTSSVKGAFKDLETRNEFLSHIRARGL